MRRFMEGMGWLEDDSELISISESVMFTCLLAGVTKTTPALSGSCSVTVLTGSGLLRASISCRWLSRLGSRCWATTMGASKSSGREETSPESAPIPPAEDPTTTRCVNELFATGPPSRLPCGCWAGAYYPRLTTRCKDRTLTMYLTMLGTRPHGRPFWMYNAVAEDVESLRGLLRVACYASGRGLIE